MKHIAGIICIITFLLPGARVSAQSDPFTRDRITPTGIVWLSDTTGEWVKHPEYLLRAGTGQADLSDEGHVFLVNKPGVQSAIILDFGKELQGAIQIITGITGGKKPVVLRVRLGESVAETLSEISGEGATATNDHAMRDFEITLPWLGRIETGNSGFRFARIDLLGETATACIKEISALSILRDIPQLGSFRCNDSLLNKIWETGAYTVHLNMQEYLWDGIKRDRLVWVGDMHPEVRTILSVYGESDVIRKSLDQVRDITPVTDWMNGISSYSMWWVLIHRDYFQYSGNLDYLKEQRVYLKALLQKFCGMVDEKGAEKLDGNRFLDWPSSRDKTAVDQGYQGLLLMTIEAGAKLSALLGDQVTEQLCTNTAARMAKVSFKNVQSKQAAALLCLSGLMDPAQSDEVLSTGGSKNVSTFYGFYMLQAKAKAGNYAGALNLIRDYWGGMLQLGATTFWEDFDTDWLNNASRIDELPVPGKVDVHGTYGDYCYKGYRHSFCHGWASGPTSFLTETVLGVQIMEPGGGVVRIVPHLGDLQWAEGTVPTPLGVITVRHDRQPDGGVLTTISAPEEIRILEK